MTMQKLQDKFAKENIAADLVCDCVGSVQTFAQGQELLEVGGAVRLLRNDTCVDSLLSLP